LCKEIVSKDMSLIDKIKQQNDLRVEFCLAFCVAVVNSVRGLTDVKFGTVT
jgi:hypothetical protein